PLPTVEALFKYAHHIRQLEFSGLIPPWYMSIGCKNLDFLKVIGERCEVPPQSTHAFFRAISAYTPTLRLDSVYFKPIRAECEDDDEDAEEEEEERGQGHAEGEEQQHEVSEGATQAGGDDAQGHKDAVNDNNDSDDTRDSETETIFAYLPEVPPEVTFSRLKTLYLFDLDGTDYDKQPWILEHAPRLEHLSWRGGYDFEFPTQSFTSALESGKLSRLESLELRGSHLEDSEIAQILSRMNRLVKLVAPRTKLGPLAMKQLFQHYETVRELDISGCENVRSWMIQMFLCKFASLEVFMADMLSLQDITTDPWVCSKLRKLSLDFELGYVDKEEGITEEEVEEESDDEEEKDVDTDQEGDEDPAEDETEASENVEEERDAATKEVEVTKVEEAITTEVDVEQTVVETAIAVELRVEEQQEEAASSIATLVEGTEIASDEDVEESQVEAEGLQYTPIEVAAAMAVAQWDQQQMEADAADAEAEENPDDLWKNLVPYVHSEARQRIIFERLGQLKYLEELNIKQQTERPYSAAEQLRAGVVQKVLDLRLENGMDLLSGLSRLREFYFPGPQEMEVREVMWIIEHWGGRLTYMTGELNRRRKVNDKLLRLLSEHHIAASKAIY
ncbi:hypothetical protein BGZ97_000635, partial [Linnemannia gamsii]